MFVASGRRWGRAGCGQRVPRRRSSQDWDKKPPTTIPPPGDSPTASCWQEWKAPFSARNIRGPWRPDGLFFFVFFLPPIQAHSMKPYGYQSRTTCGDKLDSLSSFNYEFHFLCTGVRSSTFKPFFFPPCALLTMLILRETKETG